MDTNKILTNFSQTKCVCGARKGEMKSFCYNCFLFLPQAIKTNLYNRFYEGYQEAFIEALEYLSKHKNKSINPEDFK